MMGFGMMGGGLVGLIIVGVVIYLLLNNNNGFHRNESAKNSNGALEILNEKYARGDISEEEYLRKKKNLKN